MRMKHGSDRGPTISVKPRLLAAFTAVAMMFATAVPALLGPWNQADAATITNAEFDSRIEDQGGIGGVANLPLGDDMGTNHPDYGIATYVGGDMYVGHKPDPTSNLGAAAGPVGSYAVEAEGLTVVRGKLALHPLKDSWRTINHEEGTGQGFRFGVVGFGSQFRPAAGGNILAVAGLGANAENGDLGTSLADYWGTSTAMAWNRPGWFGSAANECKDGDGHSQKCNYQANVAGSSTDVWGKLGIINSLQVKASDGALNWNSTTAFNPYASFKADTVNKMSDTAKRMGQSGSGTTLGTVNVYTPLQISTDHREYLSTDFTRSKYDWDKPDYDGKTYKFHFDEAATVNKELILEFVGTGNDAQEVFNLTSAQVDMLNQAQGNNSAYTGVSYAFKNVKSTANIIINVDGVNVDYHNGWRFFVQKDSAMVDIGNGYAIGSQYDKEYSSYAQRIMWNFHNATNVVIRGGYAKGNVENKGKGNGWGNADNLVADDDPAANMLGSVLAPTARFESHVSTNGRVWVGGDFEMFNDSLAHIEGQPDEIFEGPFGNTTSVIDQDQERHNLPVSLLSSSAANIGWNKVSGGDNQPLGGTLWGIYTTLADAQNPTEEPLLKVQDNGLNDWDNTEGSFEVHSLHPNANYYLRELSTSGDHEINTNIYLIQAGKGGDDIYASIVKAWKADGPEITDLTSSDALLHEGAIVNPKAKPSIRWAKKNEIAGNYNPLGGSSWKLFKEDEKGNKVELETVTDLVTDISRVEILKDGNVQTENEEDPIELSSDNHVALTARVVNAKGETINIPQTVTWSSDDDNTSIQDGHVYYTGSEADKLIRITATSTADPEKSTSVYVRTQTPPAEVSDIKIQKNKSDITNDRLGQNAKQQYTAVVTKTGEGATPTVRWASADEEIASVSENGLVSAKQAGFTQITATAGNKRTSLYLTVDATGSTTVFFNREKWPAANGKTILLWYGSHADSADWTTAEMSDACGTWISATVPKTNFEFVFKYDNNWWHDSIGGNFKTYDKGVVIVDDQDVLSTLVTSCPVSMETVNGNTDSGNTGGNTGNTGGNTGTVTPPSSPYADQDIHAGRFEIKNLDPGKYYIQEFTAPDGYLVSTAFYKFVVTAEGANWDPPTGTGVVEGVMWISDTPTEVEWKKVDAQNMKKPLGGAVWKLESFSNGGYAEYNGEGKGTVTDCTGNCPADPNNPLQDINSDEGMIKLQRLPRGYYRIQEKTPPSGYDAPKNTYYYFELTATPAGPVKIYKGSGSFNTTTGAPTGEGVVEVSYNNITNPRKTGTVYWGKVSTQLEDGKHVYLAGSAWSIKFKPYGAENFQDSVTITDCVKTSESTSGTCSASGSVAWAKDDNIAAGRISLSGLPWGTYEMVETKAPDGYYGDSSVTYIFTVGPDTREFQNVQIYVKNNEGKPGAPITTPQNPMGPDGKPLPEYPNQVVENTPGVVLPATGGEGNTLIVLFGFALIAISMLGCGVAMRKRI